MYVCVSVCMCARVCVFRGVYYAVYAWIYIYIYMRNRLFPKYISVHFVPKNLALGSYKFLSAFLHFRNIYIYIYIYI